MHRLNRLGLLLLLLLMSTVPGQAQQRWNVTEAETGKYPATIVPETRKPAPSGIPDMLMTEAEGYRDIAQAWYAQPTSRYRHGALGDRIEGGALSVRLHDGRTITHRLAETEVFEDIAPRLADLDLDGKAEVVTIVASLLSGASIRVFGISGDILIAKASTPFLGQANRWLNIAGIAGYTSARSTPDIAFVATPHIDGRLGFLKYVPGSLIMVAAERGFSNHVNGSSELRLSADADIDGDGRKELVLPSFDRSSLRIVGFTTGGLALLGTASLRAPIDKPILVEGTGRKTVFIVGLADGSVWRISR